MACRRAGNRLIALGTVCDPQARRPGFEVALSAGVRCDPLPRAPSKIRPPYGAGGFRGHLDPELVAVARELSLTIVTWDIDTEDWKAPKGLGPEKVRNIENQFTQQRRKTLFNILMHVQAATAQDLPSFISKLEDWGFDIAEP